MRRDVTTYRLAALAAVTLVLAATAGCNEVDDPAQAENVVLVTGVTTSGLSATCGAGDTTATISFSLNPRGGSPTDPATTFYHDVTLTSYSVGFEPAVIPGGTGAISTGYCIAGSSCSVDLVLVPDCMKPGASTTVIARIAVEGRDVNDNPVNFDVTVPLTFTP